MKSLANEYAPEMTKTVKTNLNPWYTEDIRKMKRKSRQLERKYLKSKLSIDHQAFRQHCSLLNKKIIRAKIDNTKKNVVKCGKDQKKLFSYANRLLGNNQTLGTHIWQDISGKELAQNFAEFFRSKVQNIQSELEAQRLKQHANQTYKYIPICSRLSDFTPVSKDTIKDTMSAMANKQCLLDPAPTWFIKQSTNILVPLVHKVVNKSLSIAEMPSLKTALVTPVIKDTSDDATSLNNYRPVSNLPFLSKVIEKIVYKQLNEHITKNNLLDPLQSAYRPAHSTETALLKVQNDILQYLDNNCYVALVMLDVSAAFDVVNHQQLLNCFKNRFGIDGNVLHWIKSYLSDRSYYVTIGGCRSNQVFTDCGFPQGATLAGIFYGMHATPLGDISVQ